MLQEYTGVSEFQMLDAEEQSLELQYRNKKVYGTGLGTSVNWEIDDFGHGMIFNDFFPEVEVPLWIFLFRKFGSRRHCIINEIPFGFG